MVPTPLVAPSPASGRAASGTAEKASPLDDLLLAEIARHLGEARLAELLKLLAVELEHKPRFIREALADADLPRAVHEAQSLKVAAATLGAGAVAGAAGEFKEALAISLRSGRSVVPRLLSRMSGAIAEARSAIAIRAVELLLPGRAA